MHLHANCNCVMFYQPRPHSNVTICGYSDAECVGKINREIRSNRNGSFKCDHCLVGCFSINYDTTYSTAMIFNEMPFLNKRNLPLDEISVLHIYYGSSSFRNQKRDELVGFTEFLCKISLNDSIKIFIQLM